MIVAGLLVLAATAAWTASTHAAPMTAVPGSSHPAVVQPGAVLVVQAYTIALQAPEPQKEVKADIDIDRGGGRWYANPVWIAIGVIALVVLVLLIALAVRGGGGSTVVR